MSETTDRAPPGIRVPLLWFAFLGPPIIWAARFGVSYSVVPYVCARAGPLLLQALTVVALAATAAAGVAGWQQWRRAGGTREMEFGGVAARARFMAVVGMLSAGLFALVIAAEAMPIFLVDPCQGAGVPL